MAAYLCFFFDFVVEVSSTSSFCSNPDALGIDESEKGIFLIPLGTLPNCLLARRSKTIGWATLLLARWGTWPSGRRARSLLPLALVSGFMRCDRVVFGHSFADVLVFFR